MPLCGCDGLVNNITANLHTARNDPARTAGSVGAGGMSGEATAGPTGTSHCPSA